ncbi:hypothetical protein [Flavobacterium panici]|nr:hypothetical protein [Flavobacterium panici]
MVSKYKYIFETQNQIMRTLLLALPIILLPLFASAQNFDPSKYGPQKQDLLFPGANQNPKLPQLETVKPLSRNDVEKTKAKLAREEQKLIKLAEKTWQIELDLRAKRESLKNLENTSKNNNDPDYQKNIEKLKKEIAISQNKLDDAKSKQDFRAEKVLELEIMLEESKFTRKGS